MALNATCIEYKIVYIVYFHILIKKDYGNKNSSHLVRSDVMFKSSLHVSEAGSSPGLAVSLARLLFRITVKPGDN